MVNLIAVLIVILGVMALSATVFASNAEGTGIVWRAINKATSSIFDLADVSFTSCSNGQVLKYQTSNSSWVCSSGYTKVNSLDGATASIVATNSTLSSTQATFKTLTQGTGITITNGTKTLTIANDGVTSLTGTANNVTVSASTGAVTLNTGSNVVITGGSAQTITKGLTLNSGTLGGSLNANNQRITSLGTPTASTDAEPANRMGLLGNKVTSTCANGSFLKYQSSNSTWICATPAFEYNFLSAGIAAGVGSAWTNMPAAQTELYASASRRLTIDTATFNEARISVGYTAVGATNAILGLQYSVDGGTTWKAPNNGTSGKISNPNITLITAAPQSKITSWFTLTSEAKATDVLWRITGDRGDGTADPAFTNISVQFR